MAFDSGYFTSTTVTVNEDGIPVGDKAKNAAFFALEKYHLKGNGISLKPTSAFYVAPKSGLIATVSAGWGIMEGYPFHLTEDLDITMTSSVSDQTLYIGVRLDVAGNEYTDDDVVARTTFVAATDRVFAIIVIPANAVTLTTAMITDTRYSSTYCGVTDEYDVALAAMVAAYTGELERITAEGLPTHAATHATGESDALAPTDIGAASLDANSKVTASEASSSISVYADSGTLALADAGKLVKVTKGTAATITIPLFAAVAFPVGTEIEITQYGAGQVTMAITAGGTLRSAGSAKKTRAQYVSVSIKCIAQDEWLLTGDLTA